jgi:hypothetical protein
MLVITPGFSADLECLRICEPRFPPLIWLWIKIPDSVLTWGPKCECYRFNTLTVFGPNGENRRPGPAEWAWRVLSYAMLLPCSLVAVYWLLEGTYCLHRNHDSDGLRAGRSGFDSWQCKIFSSPQRPDRLWSPPHLFSNGYWGLFPWV